MDQKQSFNLSSDFLGGFTAVFMKLVFVIIAAYIIILILKFLRDKYINKEPSTEKDGMIDLLTLLNKLFFLSGFGFIIGNIFQVMFSAMSSKNDLMPSLNLRGEWDYLAFGIILVFIGLGFKVGKKIIIEEKIK